jgi:hypothetical protein
MGLFRKKNGFLSRFKREKKEYVPAEELTLKEQEREVLRKHERLRSKAPPTAMQRARKFVSGEISGFMDDLPKRARARGYGGGGGEFGNIGADLGVGAVGDVWGMSADSKERGERRRQKPKRRRRFKKNRYYKPEPVSWF